MDLLLDWLEAFIAKSEWVRIVALHLGVSLYNLSPITGFGDLCPRSQLALTWVNETSTHSGNGVYIGGNNPPPHLKPIPRFSTYGRFASMMKFSDIKADYPQEFPTLHRFIYEPDVGPGSGLAGFISEPDAGTSIERPSISKI